MITTAQIVQEVKDRSGLQPFDMISVTETQADGLGWYNGAPSALVLGHTG